MDTNCCEKRWPFPVRFNSDFWRNITAKSFSNVSITHRKTACHRNVNEFASSLSDYTLFTSSKLDKNSIWDRAAYFRLTHRGFRRRGTKTLVPVGRQHNNRSCLKTQEPFTVKRKELKLAEWKVVIKLHTMSRPIHAQCDVKHKKPITPLSSKLGEFRQ